MKLKAIAIIFNTLIVVSFLFVFVMPAIFLGWDYAGIFWSGNWYLVLVFLLVLGTLNVYFFRNWHLFRALEEEDWTSVIEILEKRIARRPTIGTVRMYCHACVLTSRQEEILRLESELMERRPSLVRKLVMVLAIPHLLSGDGDRIGSYFARHRETITGDARAWAEWGYAFGLMLQKRFDEAREALDAIARDLKPGLLLALSAYLLDAWTRDEEEKIQRIRGYRTAVLKRYTHPAWKRLVDRERSELHVLVLGNLLGDVERWLYEESPTATAE